MIGGGELARCSRRDAQRAPVRDLEVIVPAFNEEDRIERTLAAIVEELNRLDLNSWVRVIDNGSADQTADAVDRISSDSGAVTVTVEGCSLPGKGRAVARGMQTNCARWVGFCDADLATPATAIAEATVLLAAGWPVVIGSRYVAGSKFTREQPLLRRVGGWGFRQLVKGFVGDVADTQCGFKFFDGDVASQVFDSLEFSGFAFDVEVLARVLEMGLPIRELAVEWSDIGGSTFRPLRHGAEVALDLWRLRRDEQSGHRVLPWF